MSQAAKAQEPSMEEILASIRRIIADDDGKPAAKGSEQAGHGASAPNGSADPGAPGAMSQDDIDAMLAGFDLPVDEAQSQSETEHVAETKPHHSAEVLELTTAMEARPNAFKKIEPGLDVYFGEKDPEPASAHPAEARRSAGESEPRQGPTLMSEQATAAATSAFSSLAHTVLMQNARTLDDLVRDMLRPMLKSWLDDNLPTIVERMVRAEIERVSRGRN